MNTYIDELQKNIVFILYLTFIFKILLKMIFINRIKYRGISRKNSQIRMIIQEFIVFIITSVFIYGGVSFIFISEWFMSNFIGSILCVYGLQIAFWNIGISSDLLGNIDPTNSE